jgi:geranylgeranyl pyrophosphate synthase
VVEIQEVIEATGARTAVEQRIDDLLGEAIDALATADLEADARNDLIDLAVYCIRRDR